METDQVDLFAAAMFGYFEQIQNTEEAGCAGEFRCDVGKADGLNGIDLDLAFVHGVASAYFHARAFPDADAQDDVATTNAIAKAFGELHGKSLREGKPTGPVHKSSITWPEST